MKNNKGFTLIELLAVIVLLSVIVTIATPSIMGISKKVKENMLETKMDLILEDAKLYGSDNLATLAESTKYYQTFPCEEITIDFLVEKGYITYDKNDEEANFVINPVDNTSLNDKKIIIYLKHKRAVAIFSDANMDGVSENSCS